MLGFNTQGFDNLGWEVLEVHRNDNVSPAPHGGGEDVPIIGIG